MRLLGWDKGSTVEVKVGSPLLYILKYACSLSACFTECAFAGRLKQVHGYQYKGLKGALSPSALLCVAPTPCFE